MPKPSPALGRGRRGNRIGVRTIEGMTMSTAAIQTPPVAVKPLIAYQVGDNDIVAHYTPEEAAAFLCEFGGYPEGEFTADDVEVVDAALLDADMQDEDGNKCPPLRLDLEAATAPTYLHGWE